MRFESNGALEVEVFYVHAFSLLPGYTFGRKSADIGIFSQMTMLDERDGGEIGSMRYSFSMSWMPGNRLSGWELSPVQ
jgi:hypothetical protein